jgi:hypothetical protein
MQGGHDEHPEEPRRSASAEAAALRLTESEPELEPGDPAEPDEPEPEGGARPSASAEAAALRWREAHAEE